MRRHSLLAAFAILALLLGASPAVAPAAPSGPAPFSPSAPAGLAAQDPEFPGGSDDGGDDDPEEPDDGDDTGTTPPPMKPPPIAPDSLRKFPAATLPGGAPVETLLVRPQNVLGRPDVTAPTAAPPKSRGTPFGLHPAAIFAVLVVGHIFLVRAVTD